VRGCLHCRTLITATSGFYELYRQPSGELYTLCSLSCLTAFVKGGDDD